MDRAGPGRLGEECGLFPKSTWIPWEEGGAPGIGIFLLETLLSCCGVESRWNGGSWIEIMK